MGSGKLQSILLGAAAVPLEERNAYLDEACGDDHLLRRQVEEMLSESDDTVSVQRRDRATVRFAKTTS